MKIVIVDDNATFRDGLRFFLEKTLNHEVIAEASNGVEFLQLKESRLAELVLIDIEMPELNGIQAVQQYLQEIPYLRAIAITMYTDKAYLVQLIDSGFRGCIFKRNIFENLNDAINQVMQGKFYFPNDIAI